MTPLRSPGLTHSRSPRLAPFRSTRLAPFRSTRLVALGTALICGAGTLAAALQRLRPGPAAAAAGPAARAHPPLPARVPVLLRKPGLWLGHRQHQAGPLPQQPAATGQPARQLLCRGAPERRQLSRAGRREHVRYPAHRPTRGEPAVHDPAPDIGDSYPLAIALAPSGHTAVVVGTFAGRVVLLDTRTRRTIAQIKICRYPVAVAIAG
jgi:hypothetical protein